MKMRKKQGESYLRSIDLEAYCGGLCSTELSRITTESGVSIETLTFLPESPSAFPPLVFVAGFASVIENFPGVLRALTAKFRVHYIETRDKASSIVPEGGGFEVEDIARDICQTIEKLGLEDGKYILLAYSLAATASAAAFKKIIRIKPLFLVMVEPSGEFRIPRLGIFITRHISWSFPVLKPFLKWYIRKFHVDMKEDYEMYNITCRALDRADWRKISPTFLAMARYRIWESLSFIDVPVLVIGASRDIFHNLNDALRISSGIRNSTYFDIVTNERSHSPEVCDLILDFLKKMS
jgi:pimeloyl-ACP methyl ester carboxylesterase